MTDEQINIAIATHLGWEFKMMDMVPKSRRIVKRPGGTWEYIDAMPDYCSDLNLMHEVEATLFGRLDWSACAYETLLQKETTSWAWYATARQRAEVYLRTIEKWEGE